MALIYRAFLPLVAKYPRGCVQFFGLLLLEGFFNPRAKKFNIATDGNQIETDKTWFPLLSACI
jgi:hypothetical protein